MPKNTDNIKEFPLLAKKKLANFFILIANHTYIIIELPLNTTGYASLNTECGKVREKCGPE